MHFDRRILEKARPARRDLAAAIGLGLAAGSLVVAQAHVLSRVVSRSFLEGATLQSVKPLLLAFFLLAVARSGLGWLAEMFAQRVAGRVKLDLRSALTQHLLVLGPSHAREERSGELASTLVEGVQSLDAYLSQYLPRAAMATLLPFVVLAFVLPTDPVSGVILLITAPLIPLFMVLIGLRAREHTRRQWATLSRMSAHLLDVLQGLTTLKLLGRSREHEEVIRSVSDRFRRTTMGVLRVAFLSGLVLELAATMGTALVAVGVGLRLLYGRLSFEQALFVLILAPELYRPLRQLGGAFHSGLPGAEAAKRIFGLLEVPAPAPVGMVCSAVPDGPVDLDFEDVTFAYDKGARPALRGVTFRIPALRKVALVGPTGAGKTTVSHLLLRFLEPDGGTIRISGTALSTIDQAEWRRRVAWVPQNPHLFHGTVADNIRFGREGASGEEIVEASRMANAHSFIEALPQGYETAIGERGARLSGGQAQGLALARAFLKNAPLLVLDEPTAHLDPENEAIVGEAMRRLMEGRTVLLIAHRLTTVTDADRILLMADGRVVEEGTHPTLMAEGHLYPRLVRAFREAT